MNPSRVTTMECGFCKLAFSLPMCRVKRTIFCSSQCGLAHRRIKKEARKRICAVCESEFFPRAFQLKSGQGKVCSKGCRTVYLKFVPHGPEWNTRVSLGQKGRKGKAGESSPHWKGGYELCYRQRLSDGRISRNVAQYRANNPDKVREWSQKRRLIKTGRLPKGTVAKLYSLQGGKCVICKMRLPKNYHVDHITPLAKGGKHEPSNVQLLCPTYNVRKSAKDPIRFMQEMGYLL
jgi:5-methylcytosine-specific restriction endonuclease McrA